MAGFIQNILWNSVEGFVEAGTRSAGGYAGDALLKAGDLIEFSGRSVGNGIERRASGYGTLITGQSYQSSAKALPSTALRPVAKRSNSSPASTKAVGPTSRVPLGAKKTPAGSTAKRQVNGARSTVGGVQKALPKAAPKALPKPYPQNQPYGTSAKPSTATSNSSSYPTQKKSAVRPGQSKPFKYEEKKPEKNAGSKPYPGTSTIPGQGSKVPVQQQKYKPLERMKGTAEKGKVQHI